MQSGRKWKFDRQDDSSQAIKYNKYCMFSCDDVYDDVVFINAAKDMLARDLSPNLRRAKPAVSEILFNDLTETF